MRLVFAFFFLCSLAVAGAATKVLKYSEDGAPTNLDPVQASSIYDSLVLWNIYDTLYSYKYLKRPYELKPNLASAMPEISKDGLTLRIRLKKGVRFADDPAFPGGRGREVVARDFVYSMKRQFDPKNNPKNLWLWRDRIVGLDEWKEVGADYAKEIDGLKSLDSHTLQIKLKRPYYQFLYTLAMAQAGVVPEEAVVKYKREFPVKPVGSGPFKLESFSSEKAVLVRNPSFRREKLDLKAEGYDPATHGFSGIQKLDGQFPPFVDRLEIRFIDQIASRWNSFTKGSEIQFSVVPVEQLRNVTSSLSPVTLKPEYAAKYHMLSLREMGLVYDGFNMDDPRVGYHPDPKQAEQNKALRCAVRKAFDWPQRIKRYFYGLGEAFPGIVPPGLDGYDPRFSKASVTRDVEGAKKMLKEAGWTPATLPVFEWGGVSSVRARQLFELFRGWLLDIGYPAAKVKYQSYATWSDFNKAMKERKVMYVGLGYKMDYPDSENLFALLYGPNASPGVNVNNYKNPLYNELYDKSVQMPPSPRRNEVYKQMNQILVDDCVIISGFSRTYIYLWHKNVLMYPDRDVLGGSFLKYAGVL